MSKVEGSRLEQKSFLIEPELARRVDSFRFSRRFKSEGAALREIVAAGLNVLEKAEEKRAGQEACVAA